MFVSVLPAPHLRPYISSLWYCRRWISEAESTLTIPFGSIEMVINFSDQYTISCPGGSLFSGDHSWITGHMTGSSTTLLQGHHECIGLVFTQLGWNFFSKIPADEFLNKSVEGDCVFGNDLESLRNRIADITDVHEKFNVLEIFMASRLRATSDLSSVSNALQVLHQSDVRCLDVTTLCARLKLSRKTLNKHFRRYIGMSVSSYRQEQLINAVIRKLCADPDSRLIETGYEFGFFDQAHFTKQFKSYTGLLPCEYVASVKKGDIDRTMPNFVLQG